MRKVNVAILKSKLSHYLGLVAGGEELVVTSHKTPVARIVSVDSPFLTPKEPSRAVHDLRKLKGVKGRSSLSAVQTLLEDRRRR